LPNISPDETLVVDIESTSFDDKVKGLNPFQGHRIAGVAIGTKDASKQWYMPLRHSSGVLNDSKNFPFEQGIKWLQDTLGNGRDIINHNIKFDMRFLWHDGIEFKGRCIDTMVLGRLVHNDLFGYAPYSLDSLGHRYLGEKKLDEAKAYTKSIKTKDYGRIPVGLMTRYAEKDVELTARLLKKLESLLPSFSSEIWDTEQRLTYWIWKAEMKGMGVDWKKLKQTYITNIERMLELSNQIFDIVGHKFDLGKEAEMTKVLMGELGLVPKSYTEKTHKPQWNKMAFETMDHPIGKPMAEFNSLEHYVNTYCKGWLDRKGDDGRLHSDFRQAGTNTGRWSSQNPNLQNMSPEAEVHAESEEDNVIVAADYSQMEYRIFGHYTKSDSILGEYSKNPYMDFHGHLAGMLGVDRQFAKQMNFSFIYGMGKKKLITNIAGLLALKGAEDETMREQMRTYLTGGGGATAERAKQLNTQETRILANKIFNDYHRRFPEIKKFSNQVSHAIKRRGWIKNFYGRRYVFEPGSPQHQAVNYIVQGSAADCCKTAILSLHEKLQSKYPDVSFIGQVHDSVILECPKDQYEEFVIDMIPVLEEAPFRVPMLVDVKISDRYLAQAVEIEDRLELVGEDKFRQSLRNAREASKTAKTRGWAS